ncbi:MAG: histidine--tRNA ligase [Candidatus Saccharibacteria bacterium]|nr:histidine--tRNA ligase [Candidatus Saccharibacteria bacterium]
MALTTQPYKGTRDFYPDEKRTQNYIFGVMRSVSERFGYEEYDAPILEPIELYQAKSGAEIVSEQTYLFTDRGGRQVAIRPEMTPTVSRMVAGRRQELGYPLRWYSIPNLMRYERPQRGRLREHWQLNVDIFGVKGLEAEHEIIALADAVMQGYGAKRDMYTVKLNSRKLMDYLLADYLGFDAEQSTRIAKIIDHMHKVSTEVFQKEIDDVLSDSQRSGNTGQKLVDLLSVKSLDQLPSEIADNTAAVELQKLIDLLQSSGITNVVFDITIMRGFDYYTDIVFEVMDTDPENNRSMFGGGRYDGLVGLFGVEPVPTVGFGMGDVTIANFLTSHGLMPELKVATDVYVVLVGDVYSLAQGTIASLRSQGLNVAVDTSGRKPGDQIKNAVKKNINFVLFIGDKELADGKFSLKNLADGQESNISVEEAASAVKAYHQSK